jgi:hypothetical protein
MVLDRIKNRSRNDKGNSGFNRGLYIIIMPNMRISVINHTNGNIKDKKIIEVIRSINRQIQEDFEPYWSMGAVLRLEGRSEEKPNPVHPIDMRGDAIIYVWDRAKDNLKSLEEEAEEAIGYHEQNFMGIPYGFVFIDVTKKLGQDWSIALSHEALEMIADPELNLLVQGPHPEEPENRNRYVFHYYEVCDAVSGESYEIDGIKVSNFVLPLYFTGGEEYDGRNDFLGNVHNGKTLKSFGVNPEGYISYVDPLAKKMCFFFNKGDKAAEARKGLKAQMKGASRLDRYQRKTSKAYNI